VERQIQSQQPVHGTNEAVLPGVQRSQETSVQAGNDPEFTVVRKRKRRGKRGIGEIPTAKPQKMGTTAPRPSKPAARTLRRPPKTQAVVIEKLPNRSYADTVREVKESAQHESLTFDITTRRAKSGNLVLVTSDKDQADSLASALKRRLGESRGIWRPSQSIALLLIGIEDSVDEAELKSALEAHDPELKASNEIRIREGRNGVRTAIVRMPISAGLKLVSRKKVRIGWATCRIKEMPSKHKGCARCSAPDHVVSDCKGKETRKCFRCKEVGHLISSCKSPNEGVHSGESDNSQRAGAPAEQPPSSSCP